MSPLFPVTSKKQVMLVWTYKKIVSVSFAGKAEGLCAHEEYMN